MKKYRRLVSQQSTLSADGQSKTLHYSLLCECVYLNTDRRSQTRKAKPNVLSEQQRKSHSQTRAEPRPD